MHTLVPEEIFLILEYYLLISCWIFRSGSDRKFVRILPITRFSYHPVLSLSFSGSSFLLSLNEWFCNILPMARDVLLMVYPRPITWGLYLWVEYYTLHSCYLYTSWALFYDLRWMKTTICTSMYCIMDGMKSWDCNGSSMYDFNWHSLCMFKKLLFYMQRCKPKSKKVGALCIMHIKSECIKLQIA